MDFILCGARVKGGEAKETSSMGHVRDASLSHAPAEAMRWQGSNPKERECMSPSTCRLKA